MKPGCLDNHNHVSDDEESLQSFLSSRSSRWSDRVQGGGGGGGNGGESLTESDSDHGHDDDSNRPMDHADDDSDSWHDDPVAMMMMPIPMTTPVSTAMSMSLPPRDDRPSLLRPMPPTSPSDVYFDASMLSLGGPVLLDPVAGGSVVDNFSPHGASLDTLEYNVRHAIERRDEARCTSCLTELFRHFVALNRPMRRVANLSNLDRQAVLEMGVAIGPFANSGSLGMHQRLLTLLLGVGVRQVGCATPLTLSFVKDRWRVYERHLFHRPFEALAVLVGIGATLCHARKDASVAYARFVFEDTAKMRNWRTQVLAHADVLDTFLGGAQDAQRARRMLLCNKVYYTTRLRLRRYQAVCIGTPHPEYMCQGRSMHRVNVRHLVDSIKGGWTNARALSLVQDVEEIMIFLDANVYNLYDRDAFEDLQVDMQIFLYLLHRVLCAAHPQPDDGPDALLTTSEAILRSAPNQVLESYASRLWRQTPDRMDLICYGILGEPVTGKFAAATAASMSSSSSSSSSAAAAASSSKRSKTKTKVTITVNDLVDTRRPIVVPKSHAVLPPSLYRDADHILRELSHSEIQRHPHLGEIRFLMGLYRLHHMWNRCVATIRLRHHADERVVMDRDVFDVTQPYRVLYQCQATHVCAAEVRIHGHVTLAENDIDDDDDDHDHGPRPRPPHARAHTATVTTSDATEADILVDHLSESRDSFKAIVVGPWACQEGPRLDHEVRSFQALKTKIGVHPHRAFVKRMVLLDFKTVSGCAAHVLGRTYLWVVYLPCPHRDGRVVMSIDELKRLVGTDPVLDQVAKSVLTPVAMVRPLAVMKRTCGEFCAWRVGDNYVSFVVHAHDTTVRLTDIRFHAIAETLLGQCPDLRHTHGGTSTSTMQAIQAILEKGGTHPKYASAMAEMAACEALLA